MTLLSKIKYQLLGSYPDLRDVPYDLRFSKLGIREILRNLHRIEEEIIDDLTLTCLNFFEENKGTVQGDFLLINNTRYKIHLEFIKAERKLFVKVYPIANTTYSRVSRQRSINGFGSIKELEFDFPYSIRKNFNQLIEMITQQVIFAYLSLQKVFKSEFKSFGEHLFNDLYDILNIEIERQNKKHLIGKSYFNVTLRSNKKFRYFFDHENIDILIEHFKVNQSQEYSPLEMLSSLISQEALDTLNMLIDVQEGDFDHIQSNDFVSQEHDMKFWVSESLLVNNMQLTSYTITKVDKLIFQISCPKELEAELTSVYTIATDSLSIKFNDNLKSYIKHASELTKIPKPGLTEPFRLKVAEWLGTFTGHAVYQFIKKTGKS